jgi:chromosomal replication initiation ATPase DnaA
MIVGCRQLSLPLDHEPGYHAADFFPTTGSQLALEWLEKSTFWTGGRLVLWGEAGAGKTHLLHMWASARGTDVINGAELRGIFHSVSAPVVIDNADLLADEIDLFHLLNNAAEAGQPVLLAARQPPSRLAIELADLSSRLRASTTIEICPPNDNERAALLARFAASRQLVLNIQVRNFLLTHLPRTPAALIEAVTRLDRAALANGAKISRSLAASLLADIATDEQRRPELLSNGHSQDTPNLL